MEIKPRNMECLSNETIKGASKYDIIIVGAGLSGLTSALKVLEKEPSLRVKILESSNRIGGQINKIRLGEIGGKWITADQFHIYKMLKDLKVPMSRRVITNSGLQRCWDIDRGLSSMLIKHEVGRYIQELDLRCQYFLKGETNPYQSSGSMHKNISNRLYFSKSKKIMNNLVLLISGVDAHDILFNDFMTLCCSNGGLNTLIAIYLELPDSIYEISSIELLKAYEKKIANVEVLMKRKVLEIRHFQDYVEVTDSEKEIHTADVLILAVPWNNIENINISPPIPLELRRPPPSLDHGKTMITSFLARYADGHWRAAGFSGNLFLNEPFLIIGYEYRASIYGGMVIHEEGIESILRSITLHTLGQQFGEDMLLPIEYTEMTYEMSPMTGLPLTSPWNRIVWSSSASAASCYRGRLGGAVQSGLRAAMNALLILRPQIVAWQDIAELQCSSTLISPKASKIGIWMSSWNAYNLSLYSVVLAIAAATLRYLYQNDYI